MAKGKKLTPREIYWAKKHQEEQEKHALLPAGFVNHGNTCFMNSVLQGLMATALLEQIIRFEVPDTLHPLASRRSPLMTNGRGLEAFQREWVPGMRIGDVFISIMMRAWIMRDGKERSSMSPKELLSRVGEKYDQYLDFRQQDAHEFLLHLLDGMRMEELDIIKQRQPPPSRRAQKSHSRTNNGSKHGVVPESIPDEDRLTSFVDMVWSGNLSSVLICQTCKHVSHTYEDFDDLSLSISHDESRERKRDRLRAFASKFMSSSHRHRDNDKPRPQSVSQPPTPPIPLNTIDSEEVSLEPPRRRSLEASSFPETTGEPRKSDIPPGFGHVTGPGGIGEVPIHRPMVRSRNSGEPGLGKLGRKISVGMALSGKIEKKLLRAEREPRRVSASQDAKADDKGIEAEEEWTPMSTSSSKASSRQPSPGPTKRLLSKAPRLSEHDVRKEGYLRRLLQDTTPSVLNPLAVLRMANPGLGSNPAWSKVGATHGLEDCLRMFTAVEVLDGDNMFGCRNCWKIANGQVPMSNAQTTVDSDNSSDEDGEREPDPIVRPTVFGAVRSFSVPHLLPSGIVGASGSSTASSPSHLASDAKFSEVTELGSSTLELNLGSSTFASTTSFVSTPPQLDGAVPISKLPPQYEDGSWTQPTSDPRVSSIPTIAPISPPPDAPPFDSTMTATPRTEETSSQLDRTQFVHFSTKMGRYMASPRDSLRLPDVHSRHRREMARDGESSLSSEESECDDTSAVSDGDGSVASAPSSAQPPRPARPGLPRSKQVVYRRALKRYLIERPPPILVIHLKRFQQLSKSPVTLFGNLKKLDEYVSFPEYLDIRPFLAPKKEDYGLGKGELRGRVMEKGNRMEDRPCVYRLYAVVVHIGNMLGGHYISYTALPPPRGFPLPCSEDHATAKTGPSVLPPPPVKIEGAESTAKPARQWCYISDTIVRLASLEEVLKAKAYLCMYERVP